MRFSSRQIMAALAPVITLAFLLACSRNPEIRKKKYVQSGHRYFEQEKYPEAVIEFTNAVHIDPGYADAHYQLAESYLKLRQGSLAYQELARTVELQPENYPARIEMANLLIASSNLRQAQEQTDLLLERQPNNPAVRSTVSNLLAAKGDLPGAIIQLQQVIALAPDRAESYVNLALLQLRNNQVDAAETSFKKAIELNPMALQPHLLLGNYYQSRSRFPEAEQQFHHAVDLDAKNSDARAALARLYLAEGRKDDAEKSLKQAMQVLAGSPAGYRMLGDFYVTTGEVDKAIGEYAVLFQEHPGDMQVRKGYIALLIQKNRFADARNLNNEILKANSHDDEALVYQSLMEINDGDVNHAIQMLQTLIKDAPENSEAHYALGVAFQRSGDLQRAVSQWKEALRLRPDLFDAERALAEAALRDDNLGTPEAMEELGSQIIRLQPAGPDGYALHGLSNLKRGNYASAEKDIRTAIEAAPKSSIGYVQMGNLRLAQNQYSAAEEAYQGALDRDPNSKEALRGLMNAYLSEKRPDKAIAAANAQVAKASSNSGFYDLLGTALFRNKKDLSGAQAAFTKSAELDKNNSDALIKLGQVQVAEGSVDQAITTYQRALKDNPFEATFYLLLGDLYVFKKDWKKAKEAYENDLALRPQDAVGSNNLALVVLHDGGDLNVAMSLAETARRGLPDSPSVADTLGWIYYQKGVYQSAVRMFKEALKLGGKEKAPDQASIHYHLGLAYEKTGAPGLARQQLEQVLKINPNYSDAASVKKELAELKP